MQFSERWSRGKTEWNILTYYQRFESVVAFALTVIIALIVLVALYRLFAEVVIELLFKAVDPLEHAVFQSIFGEVVTLLIALEFNHTLRYVVTRHQSIIQTRVVVLIALLAVALIGTDLLCHISPGASVRQKVEASMLTRHKELHGAMMSTVGKYVL